MSSPMTRGLAWVNNDTISAIRVRGHGQRPRRSIESSSIAMITMSVEGSRLMRNWARRS